MQRKTYHHPTLRDFSFLIRKGTKLTSLLSSRVVYTISIKKIVNPYIILVREYSSISNCQQPLFSPPPTPQIHRKSDAFFFAKHRVIRYSDDIPSCLCCYLSTTAKFTNASNNVRYSWGGGRGGGLLPKNTVSDAVPFTLETLDRFLRALLCIFRTTGSKILFPPRAPPINPF